MTPTQAAALARRLRKLLRAGEITHAQHSLADALLWTCRAPGSAMLSVSYSRLQRLAHVSRDTVARGIARLVELGVVRKTRRRVRLGWASRQVTNLYELLATATESDGQTVSKVQEITTVERPRLHLLEAAIASFERRRADRYALLRVGV